MGFTNRVGITYHVSLTAVLCLWLCGRNGAESSFKIFRGEQDIFTNMKCNPGSERCNDDQCKNYSAECVDAKCKFCRCMNGKSTFMINQDGGVCKSDEEIVPESGTNHFESDTNYSRKCAHVRILLLLVTMMFQQKDNILLCSHACSQLRLQ
jgi:hypothetical protein